jgi:hypothetical protein
MRTPVNARPPVLMSKASIAEFAGVRREVVSNWIRRSLGFPRPVDGDRYDPREVADWLIHSSHGNRGKQELEQEASLYTLAGLASRYHGDDVIAAITALICLRSLTDENTRLDEGVADPIRNARTLAASLDPGDNLLLSEVRAIPRSAGWLVSAVDDLVEAAYHCQDAFERAIAARNRFGPAAAASAGATTAVSPLLARLIAELSGAPELARRLDSIVVADPTAGAGDLLVAVANVVRDDTELRFTAAEPDQGLARLAMRRLAVRGIPAGDRGLHRGAGLLDGKASPDVLVTQLPFQSGEERDAIATLAAIDDMALCLAHGRFGVVLGSASVLTDDLPAAPAKDRADLLKDDMVEAIIRLPVGLVPYRPRYRAALWVLTQARASRWGGRVLTMDVSDQAFSHDLVDAIVDDVVTWRREGYRPVAHRRTVGVERLVADLVDPPRPLLGRRGPTGERERRQSAATRITSITRLGADLDRIGATAIADRGHVSVETLRAANRSMATESIGTLATQGSLVLRSGIRINPEHVADTGTHPVIGSDEVLRVASAGARWLDRATFADRYPKARLTEPGDVLVTLSPAAGAIVDHAGYAIVEFPVRILRVPPAERPRFPPRVLAALLFGGSPRVLPSGAVRAARRLEDHRVPLLPEDEAALLDGLLAEIEVRRQVAQREIDVLDDVCRVAIGGLIDGTLSLDSDDE